MCVIILLDKKKTVIFFTIRLPAWGGRQISKLLGLKWEMRGKENIVQNSGCVVLINHQSCLDLLGT